MLKHNRTIIHVEVKDTHEHFYFGSVAAMYEDSRVKNLLKSSTRHSGQSEFLKRSRSKTSS